MNVFVRFWVVVASLLVSIGALGFLTLSFVFPGVPMFAVDAVTRLIVVLVGTVALGVVVWSSTTHGDVVSEQPKNRT